MTRINVGVLPSELSDKHLLAEHREIKRIPNKVSSGKYNLDGIPERFKLGTGHVKFFYDKLMYLKRRYESLYEECVRRGFDVTYFGGAWSNVPEKLMNDYVETGEDRIIVLERIKERTK
jgi:hypothetical protein